MKGTSSRAPARGRRKVHYKDGVGDPVKKDDGCPVDPDVQFFCYTKTFSRRRLVNQTLEGGMLGCRPIDLWMQV
jgi:hypothetical protein